jgi:site-specific recombinase XerD
VRRAIPYIPKEISLFTVFSSALFGLSFSFLSERRLQGMTTALVRFKPQSERLRRFLAGPLGPYIESFAAVLSQQGYSPAVGWRKIWLIAELSRWLERRHITLKDLDERQIAAFLRARWRRVSKRCGEATLIALLQHLRESRVISASAPGALNDLDLVEQEYGRFLTQERGLMQSTVDLYLRMVRPFVAHHLQRGKLRLNKLVAKEVISFVLHNTARRGRWSTKSIITGLRSFLGFSFQTGRTTTNLVAAVPTVPLSNLSDLPRFLQPDQIDKVLRCCDRRTEVGKRDYAILLLLARLGLRSSEVAKLTLADIGWATGELLIRGKGARLDKLPLLQDVGEALADYLQNVRPRCSSRHVFLRSRAPHVALLGPSTLGSIVLRALDRAQIRSHHRGAHMFRHSLATRMLRNGASLAQIGQVLRHENVQTTEVYAKVDLIALRRLALPRRRGAL